MRIAVLVKLVPVSNQLSVDPQTHCLIRENAEMTVNPADLNAITAAVLCARETGGRVEAFAMGPETAQRALRTALAMGAEEAVLISDRCFGGSDTLGTAKILAAALRASGPYDLVLAGAASSDGATGQVGPMAAELLGIPSACDASALRLEEGSALVLRQCGGRRVRVRMALPCLVTMEVGSNAPILPTLRSQRSANRASIRTLTNRELDLDPSTVGARGARSLVTDTMLRENSGRQAQLLNGTAAEIAAQIKALIDGGMRE